MGDDKLGNVSCGAGFDCGPRSSSGPLAMIPSRCNKLVTNCCARSCSSRVHDWYGGGTGSIPATATTRATTAWYCSRYSISFRPMIRGGRGGRCCCCIGSKGIRSGSVVGSSTIFVEDSSRGRILGAGCWSGSSSALGGSFSSMLLLLLVSFCIGEWWWCFVVPVVVLVEWWGCENPSSNCCVSIPTWWLFCGVESTVLVLFLLSSDKWPWWRSATCDGSGRSRPQTVGTCSFHHNIPEVPAVRLLSWWWSSSEQWLMTVMLLSLTRKLSSLSSFSWTSIRVGMMFSTRTGMMLLLLCCCLSFLACSFRVIYVTSWVSTDGKVKALAVVSVLVRIDSAAQLAPSRQSIPTPPHGCYFRTTGI